MNATRQKGLFAAWSRHGGGVTALFCGGGVRFSADTTDSAVRRVLATRSGS